MRLTVFTGIGDTHETRLVPDGLSYRAACPDIDFEHAVVVSGGRLARSDDAVAEGSFVRVLPEAPAVVAAGVMIAAAVVAGVGVGVAMYKLKKAQAAQTPAAQADKQKEVLNSDSANLPFQRGATNAIATGKTQPYVMGRHGFTPYLLTGKWYELSGPGGRDQYVTQALECGFGKLVFEELRADEVMLRKFTEGVPQDGHWNFLDTPFSQGGSCEAAQDGQPFSVLTQVNTRIASATSSQSIPYRSEIDSGSSTELIVTLDPYARDVTLAISFPMGLYATNKEDGSHHSTTARIGAYFSVDGGSSWTTMPFTVTVPSGNSTTYVDRQTVKAVKGIMGQALLGKAGSQFPDYGLFPVVWSQHVIKGYELESETPIPTSEFPTGDAVLLTFQKTCTVEPPDSSFGNEFSLCCTDEVRYEASRQFSWAEISANKAAGNRCIYVKLVNESTKDSYITNSACLLYYESHCYDPEKSEAAGAVVDCPILEPKEMALSAMLAVRIKASAANEDKLRKINVVVRSVARTWTGEAWTVEKTTTSNPAAILLEILTSDIHPMSRFADTELDLNSFGGLYEFCEAQRISFNAVQTAKATKKSLVETVCGVCHASLYWNMAGILSVAWDCQQGGPLAVLDADSVIDVKVKKEYERRVDAMRLTYTEADTWEQKTALVKRNSSLVLDADSVIQELTVTGPEYLPEVQKYARYIMACQNLRPKVVTVTLGREGMFFTPWTRIRLTDDALGDEPQDLIITAVRGNGDGWELDCADYNDNVYDSGEIADYESNVREWADPADGLPSPFVRQGELEEQLAKLNSSGSVIAADPDVPLITVKASMEGLSLAMVAGGDGLKNVPKSVTWLITRPDGTEAVVEDDASAGYAFDRILDGYPEAGDLARYRVKGILTNVYGRTAQSATASVDSSGYGTWIPLVAELTAQRITGRTATLSFGQQQGRMLYGQTRYKIEIRKKGETPWYKPDLTRDPYANVDNYKAEESTPDVTAGLNTTHTFTQTLPLDGQNDVIYYESWWYTSRDKKDAYGNPVQQSARTEAFRVAPPHVVDAGEAYGGSDASGIRDELPGAVGSGVMLLGDSDFRPFGVNRGLSWEVYGEIGGEGSGEETVCVVRYEGQIFELTPEVTIGGVSYEISRGIVTIDGQTIPVDVWNSKVTINGVEYPVTGTVWIGGVAFNADDVCDDNGIFMATRHSKFFTEDGANPRDTLYEYRATAYVVDPATGALVHRADGLSVFVTALATSAADVVNSAITHNKIAPGAVQVDNLAAGCITAEKMAVRDLFAICGVFGRIQNNEITDAATNFWNLETGQFLLSNGIKDADGNLTDPASEYFAYTPAGYTQPDGTVAQVGSFWFKIANFVVAAVGSIIKGVFRVQRTTNPADSSPLLVANPNATADQTTGTPANTVKVNGNASVFGTFDASAVGIGIINAVYPVGSTYTTLGAVHPNTLFPGTTWVKIEGCFLLASSATVAAGATGGEATHVLTEQEMPSHTHTMADAGGHSHTYSYGYGYSNDKDMSWSNSGIKTIANVDHEGRATSADGAHSHTIVADGGGQAHNNMPPYLSVNIYRRTA
ncbi:MAG: hypothetical protein K6G18_06145 [Treponema sp.]|nr:hypothetical protein [Treponema sp.]